MASLVDGKISEDPIAKVSRTGEFQRPDSSFRGDILPSQASADRYHLYVSLACPWAHRTLIMRNFKQLQNIIDVSISNPYMGDKGWTFFNDKDPKYLAALYVASDNHYTGKISVPVLWDRENKIILNNESSEIIRIFNQAFDSLTGNELDFYPEALRAQIDQINEKVYHSINNGVYKCGFASTQSAYEKAVRSLFLALDEMEMILSQRPYLVGDKITEADLRLFTTLIRFDPVYFGHFKCNLRQLRDYPHLYQYMKSIYQIPEVKETCNFEHIKRHYYESHRWINPSGIVPLGPEQSDLELPHQRAAVSFHTRSNRH